VFVRIALSAFVCLAALAQQPPPSRFIGTVEKLAGDHLQVRSGPFVYTIGLDRQTEVHKGRTYRNLSPLSLEDEVSVRVRPDLVERRVAVAIWAEVVTFRATVFSVAPDSFDILVQRDQAPEAYRRGYSRVFLYPETRVSTSTRDLVVGAEVHVVGIDTGDGNIDALRIAIYNTDAPATSE